MATVVVVAFDNLSLTRLCVESVLANTDVGSYELIIVDNGSTDGTPAYLAALEARHPHVRGISNSDNLGFAAACNQGISQGHGDHVVLLNNDVLVPPGWLPTLLAHVSDPSVGAAGPVTNRIGNEAEVETDYETYGEFLRFAARRRRSHLGRTVELPMLAMFCFAMRRDVYEAVGELDEGYGIGLLEDDDYAARLRLAGFRLVCAEDVFIHHFGEASFGHLYRTGAYHRVLRENKARYKSKWGVEWEPYGRGPSEGYDEVVEATREAVRRHVPSGEPALVISRGDERLVRLDDGVAWHFPRDASGVWAGHYPADSDAAVALLREQVEKGARYLVVPGTGMWWLRYYEGLAQYLGDQATSLHADDACLIYRLSERIGVGQAVSSSQSTGEGR